MTTIRELAQELGISKVSVSNRIDKLGIRAELITEGKTYLLTDETADKIRASYKRTSSRTAPGSNQPQNNDELIQALTHQLQVKDEQIARLQDENKALINNLAEMNKSIQQSQYLLAEKTDTMPHDIDAEIIDLQTDQAEPKISFGKRLKFWSRGKR